MGLDIYLYRYEDLDAHLKRKEEVQDKEQLILQEVANQRGVPIDDLSDQDRDNAYSLFKYWCLGQDDLNKYGWVEGDGEWVQFTHEDYPDHLFQIGYFRSSYNDAGINWVLRQTLGKDSDLFYIFNPSDEYIAKVDWNEALIRAEDVLQRFSKFVEENGEFTTMRVPFNSLVSADELVGSEKEALEKFMEAKRRHEQSPGPNRFTNREGWFSMLDPAKVRAIFTGTEDDIFAKLNGHQAKKPCVYLVIEANEETYQSYIDSLQIIIDTIKFVLNQSDPEKYVLHWSG